MGDYTRSFKKIIPYLRGTTLETIENNPILGEKLEISTEQAVVEVYLHRAETTNAPVLFELHGGGFVLGHAAKDDALCEMIKDRMDIHVVGINYRKAPEYPYPAALLDVVGVIEYFAQNAADFGMDKKRFAVMGFSAGANLATVASMILKDREDLQIVCQVLHYPFLDAVADPYGKEKHPADLPCEVMEAFNELYSTEEQRSTAMVSPALASEEQLRGVAPAIIVTAKEDALCREGQYYGELLKKAGVPVEVKAMKYAHHGYIEDYYNKPCYETIPEDTKASYHGSFGEAAKEAMQYTMEKLTEYFNSTTPVNR
jgi:acetyl esterase